ncbi:hypothetical protein BD626DRAFT_571010 [Schizophyllum amplum]|uniref:Uncharacterized protein n=1 Tax=Schizophyllum amplum TaxID=97359 RepID=A0A550C9J7_9AGAR|nr:hypothetical protein BD626DRAFT_571010 [Auriculariopsis ampla]
MAKSKKRKKAAASEDPPGGEPKPKPKTPKQKANPLDHVTPLIATPFPRSVKARDKVIALVGGLICLVTGMWDHPHFLHCAHIVARSLESTHKLEYEFFRDSIGIAIRDKHGNILRKVLNLDTSINQEIFHAWIHLLFDGTSVRKNVGQGAIALVPEDFDEILAAIKENHDLKLNKNYRELCPKRTYRYKLRVLTNKKYWFGRHAGADRTYAHLSADIPSPEVLAQADCEEAGPLGEMKEDVDHASAVFGPENAPAPPESALPKGKAPAEVTNGDVTFHILDSAAEEMTLVSHANPIFFIRDYAQKIRYRVTTPGADEGLNPEHHSHFTKTVWPAVSHWFERDPKAFVSKERSKTETGHNTRAGRSATPEGPATVPGFSFAPRIPEAQRRANTTAGALHATPPPSSEPPSSPSPADDVEQPRPRPALRSVAASRSTRSAKQAVRFDSPDETPSSPEPERQAPTTSAAVEADAARIPGDPSTSETVLETTSGGISIEKVTADAAQRTPFERTAGHEEGTKSVPNADRHIEPRPKRAAKTNPTDTSAPPTAPSVAPPSVAPRPAPSKDPPGVRRSTRLNGEQQPALDPDAVPKAPDKPPVPDSSAAPPPAAPSVPVDPPPPLASSVPIISGRRLRSHTKRAHNEVVAAAADNPEGPAEPPEPPDPPEPPRKRARVTKATAVDTAPQPLAKKRRPGKHKGRPTQTNEDT